MCDCRICTMFRRVEEMLPDNPELTFEVNDFIAHEGFEMDCERNTFIRKQEKLISVLEKLKKELKNSSPYEEQPAYHRKQGYNEAVEEFNEGIDDIIKELKNEK